MKQFITSLITVLLFTANVLAQVPQKMSYQAVLRNSSNALITSSPVGMKISILQGSATGTVVYSETQTPATNANGLVSIEIGGGTGFSTINWANGPYFIKTETDPLGGTNYTITGTSQLLSVPYALHAKTAESVVGGGNGFVHYVGEQYGGGVVFHVFKDAQGNEHGLVAALTDTAVIWSNVDTASVSNAQSSWDGLSNSNAIINQLGHTNSAAKYCLDLVTGGQSDWYLPSITEMNTLWNNLYHVNKALSTISGANVINTSYATGLSTSYWTSNEYGISSGRTFEFFDGSISGGPKTFVDRVRAIRAY